ncbi:type VI secretion system-associated FHA domain protein TagH [Psychromonas aquimarina]|uniref:type VI secretion system-associated FHA domain protein TagH n=1 Tax=Psychromonas aquimarina TaxID=444919 RepID=UPI00041904B9|nr:type VI secretion system-associated FHA domain protein TagH [Psychromonas aquimarina]
MQVNFKIVSYHRLSPEQVSEISVEQNALFGRSDSNDWYLPDPEKVVSGTHVEVVKEADGFYLYDRSTNGVYINRSVEALGDKKHKLCSGDLLSIGDYEIAAELSGESKDSLVNTGTFNSPSVNVDTPAPAAAEPASFLAHDLLQTEALNNAAALPAVNNDLNDHFCAPASIPEEWDLNLLVNNTDTSVSRPQIKPAPQKNDHMVSPVAPRQVSSEPAPAAAEPVNNTAALQPPREPHQVSPVNHTNSPMDEFLKGLGISKNIAAAALPDEIYFELGQSMNLMLLGLIKSLRTRASLKNEFKINQTTFQQQENNPLKFSATIDDVFQNLYLHRSSSFLSSKSAIDEAFNDTENHDKALVAGTLGALQGLLEQLDPERIRENNYQEHYLDKIIPKNKPARNWNMFLQLHENLKDEISTHGSSALTDDFVKAYDQTIKSLKLK